MNSRRAHQSERALFDRGTGDARVPRSGDRGTRADRRSLRAKTRNRRRGRCTEALPRQGACQRLRPHPKQVFSDASGPGETVGVQSSPRGDGPYRVSTVTSAERPGRSATSPGGSTSEMRTGTRWTTFTKLPVELSGGSSEKLEPVPPARLSTLPESLRPGNASTV